MISRHLLIVSLLLPNGTAFAGAWQPQQLLTFTVETCRAWEQTNEPAPGIAIGPIEKSKIEIRDVQFGTRHRLRVNDKSFVELDVINRVQQRTQFLSRFYRKDAKPLMFLSLNADCSLQVARKINYSDKSQALNIVSLDANLEVTGTPQWLNPPLKFIERSSDSSVPLRVGMVDSGVNYLLPEINRRLARDANNKLIGYDFWDQDDLPYDAHPMRSEFFVQRHGTRTASLLLREAPGIELVPYRYPRPDMSRMRDLVAHAKRHQVTILGMPLGSNRAHEWQAFAQAARNNPELLFIVSAGNNGRDIDNEPVYPASLNLDNVLVVTSADDFVRPAERTNWGKIAVDYLIPAERIALIDYSGEEVEASGSSYAVSRLTALAAKLKMAHRQWGAADIVAELRRRFSNDRATTRALNWVSSGYIADPLAGAPIRQKRLRDLHTKSLRVPGGLQLALNILVLDPVWSHDRIEQAVQTANSILAQCGITTGDVQIHSVIGDDYLRDLSTGSARTLLKATKTSDTTVVFARDTRMQEAFTGEAFGFGNTRNRPWLANSVWLVPDVEDTGIALAHELYHVIANHGGHVEGSGNLMQSRTHPESLLLTPDQCQRAQANGIDNGLLKKTLTW